MLEQFRTTAIGTLATDVDFQSFMHSLAERKLGRSIADGQIYMNLRNLGAKTNNREAHKYHFDNFTITALAPIVIPQGPDGNNGDLHVYCGVRRLNDNTLANLLYKYSFQNIVMRKLASLDITRRTLGARTIALKPGSLYLFCGFTDYHGNGPIGPGKLRATALFHYHMPCMEDFWVRLIPTTSGQRTHRAASRET